MRRLPIFFLLDCSESMVGDNFDKLQDALNNLTSTLKKGTADSLVEDPARKTHRWVSSLAMFLIS